MAPDPAARPIIVFDVNETLLDVRALEPLFRRLFGSESVLREWFAQLILYAEAVTLAEIYVPFGTIAAGALRMLADARQVQVTDQDREELRSRMQALPPHPEVPGALRRLGRAGFRMVTLTNSTPHSDGGPLERAGIAGCFERQFSVDAVQRYKPAPETYRMVAQALGVATPALCLVAAHAWDVLGAQRAGCRGVLVTRTGHAALPIGALPQPDIIGADLEDVAGQMIGRWPA